MLSYNEALSAAIKSTIPDGKVYYAGDAGDFYIFNIVPKDFPVEIKGAMFGITFTAVDKTNGRIWDYKITDASPEDLAKIKSITKSWDVRKRS